jgi:hypothetical protein
MRTFSRPTVADFPSMITAYSKGIRAERTFRKIGSQPYRTRRTGERIELTVFVGTCILCSRMFCCMASPSKKLAQTGEGLSFRRAR